MNVRPYDPGDLDSVVALWKECELVRPWNDPEQDVRRAISSPASTILVGCTDNRLIATCMVGHDGHRGWLYYVAVSPEHRGQGFGKAITTAAEEWLKQQGAIKAMLMVRRNNETVIDFYRSSGYAEAEVTSMEKWLTPDGKRPGAAHQ